MDRASELEPKCTQGARVEQVSAGHYRLSIPGGSAGAYRLAQLDDYSRSGRGQFRWRSPCSIRIKARVSENDLPGTWGFGWWNDPFAASLGLSGMARRLPTLPNAAWFFHASPANYLSLRDDLPAQGLLAAVFSSPVIPSLLLAPGLLAAPLLAWRASARFIRHLARQIIHEDSCLLQADAAGWHTYRIDLAERGTCFYLDETLVYESNLAPKGRLGLVVWIDNQYAAFTPAGRLSYGTLQNPPAWMEIMLVNVDEVNETYA